MFGEEESPRPRVPDMSKPYFFYFGEKLGLMRKFASFYVVVALILLVAAMPPLLGVVLAAMAGAACGGLQLLAVRFGKKGLFMLPYVLLVVGLTVAVYFRIGPFETGTLQVASLAVLAVAVQRALCGYLQGWALGGATFTLQGKEP
jgi:hypothetical protein